jgi:NAD(P)-dependent dehydrogenase (short-subunit alcohol dehydrogenase family)
VSDVAVVTGAARGFGFEIAKRLVARGLTVFITDVDAEAVAQAVERLGPGASGQAADARDPEAHRAVAKAAADLGTLAVWVNNAGVVYAAKAWEHRDVDVTRTVEVNLLGVMHGSRAAIEVMGERGGHILNIGSMSSFGPVPGFGVYAATKAGVMSFTTSLQGDLQLAGIPIRMHVICPDAADTRMVRDVADDEDAALLFSGSGLLDPGKVADAAVDLLDSKRIVHAMPRYRAALLRFAARYPRTGLVPLKLLRRVGDRRRPGAS